MESKSTLKQSYRVLGAMSGTSVDGLDLALCDIQKQNGHWSFDIIRAATQDYSTEWHDRLSSAVGLSALELLELNVEYGRFVGTAMATFLEGADAPDLIASHGHTVFHQVERGFTYQIGAGQEIANITRVTAVADFRSGDLALGGQGAPLVPIGDKNFFYDYDACLNLGGISNVSFQRDGKRVAFDIGAANMLLNHIIRHLDLAFDDGGALARQGAMIPELFEALNALPYFKLSPPKSLGFEWFQSDVEPILDGFGEHDINDLLATAVHHIAYQVGRSVEGGKMLITGGGAKNTFLVEQIDHYFAGEVVVPPDEVVEFKEAAVFGLMGVLRIREEVNCLSSVTGALRDNCGGVIYLPN